MEPRAEELIETLGLEPHPEGGYYREIYRSVDQVSPPDGRGARAVLTTIYFLLNEGEQSRWHQVDSDEVWHLYEGGPLELLEMDASGGDLIQRQLTRVGDEGMPVHTIAARNWQAARSSGSYTLVGCTVAPGFDFKDFRMLADNAELSAKVRVEWPDVASLI
jgi:predicted cupin superfamily sugar epimerase